MAERNKNKNGISILRFNKLYPCPTDRYMLMRLWGYRSILQEMTQSWRNDAIGGLLRDRMYADLDDLRVKVIETEDALIPVITLRPVGYEGYMERLNEYRKFFNTYMKLRDILLVELRSQESTGKINKEDREYISYFVNIFKLMMVTWDHGVYDDALFSDFEGGVHDPIYHSVLRSLGFSLRIGQRFEDGEPLYSEPDSDLIKSFRVYTRKMLTIEHAEDAQEINNLREIFSELGVSIADVGAS